MVFSATTMYAQWTPGDVMPDGLIDKIMAKLEGTAVASPAVDSGAIASSSTQLSVSPSPVASSWYLEHEEHEVPIRCPLVLSPGIPKEPSDTAARCGFSRQAFCRDAALDSR